MSSVVYLSHLKPDKKLLEEIVYGYYPDSEMKDKIMNDIMKHMKVTSIPDDTVVDISVKISFKKYDIKTNDTKNT